MGKRFERDEAERRRDSPELVYKENANGLAHDRAPAVTPLPNETARWQNWIEKYVNDQLVMMDEVVGRAIGMERRAFRDEIGLLRRELAVLKEEVAVERKLKNLQTDIATARADVPKLPDIEARLEAEQVALKREVANLTRELAETKDKLAYAKVDIGQVEYGLRQLERKPPETAAETLTKIYSFLEEEEKAAEPPLMIAGHVIEVSSNGSTPQD